MSWLQHRIRRDERGASLILAIVFMLVAGAIGAGLTTTVSSGLANSASLAAARNREYAADGGIETLIAQARGNSGTCPATSTIVPTPTTPPTKPLDGFPIRVDCDNAPTVTLSGGNPLAQTNIIFSACVATGATVSTSAPCSDANVVIRAEVNFQGTGAAVKTYVQSWSVNG
jgi:hypothetical protein